MVMSCKILCINSTGYYYQPKLIDESAIIEALNALAEKHPRWAFLNALSGCVNWVIVIAINVYAAFISSLD
jgi:hypothetical protein